ncbi:MAG: toxin-antitoxin system YwqK family antitoxin [Candidatus Omnitrophica bacterium]|nr:toxin-antitoxin system YwqK family antitoxin [Candidatus Omnitrophota bacterium]
MNDQTPPEDTTVLPRNALRWVVVLINTVIAIALGIGIFFFAVYFDSLLRNLLSQELGVIDIYISKVAHFLYFVCPGILIIILVIFDAHKWRVWTIIPRGVSNLIYGSSKKKIAIVTSPEEEYKQGKIDGVYKEYHLSGQLKKEVGYLAGNKDGVYKEYYPAGKLKKEVSYIGGKMNGLFRTYYEHGQKEQETVYRDGLIDGTYRSFYEDGVPHQIKQYINGKLNGIYKAIDENGIPFFEITFKDDVQHGSDRVYDQEGVLRYWDTYIDGIRVNRKTYNQFGVLKFDHYFEEAITKVQSLIGEGQVVEREQQAQEKRQKRKKTGRGRKKKRFKK